VTQAFEHHPLLADMADAASPAFLFAPRGALMAANAAAAAFWGLDEVAALSRIDFAGLPVAAQIPGLLAGLPANGAARLERLRLMPPGRTVPLTAQTRRVVLPDGGKAVLAVGLERVAAVRLDRVRRAAPPAADAPPTIAPEAAPLPLVTPPAAEEERVVEILPVAAPSDPPATEPAAPPATPTSRLAGALLADDRLLDDLGAALAGTGPLLPMIDLDAAPASAESPSVDATLVDASGVAVRALDAMPDPASRPEEAPAPETETAQPGEIGGIDAVAEVAPAAVGLPIAPEPEPVSDDAQAPLAGRAAALAAAAARGLRFAWRTDENGHLAYVSPHFVAAIGPGAFPADGETLEAFAERRDIGGLAAALAGGETFADLPALWPIDGQDERAAVTLSASPAESGGGWRGLGLVTRVARPTPPVTSEPEAEAIQEPEAEAILEPEAEDGEEPGVSTRATINPREIAPEPEAAADAGEATEPAPSRQPRLGGAAILPFPGAEGAPQRRLTASDDQALRTIARVLGGPIAVPTAGERIAPPAQPLLDPPAPALDAAVDAVLSAGAEAEADAPASAPADLAAVATPVPQAPHAPWDAERRALEEALAASRAREGELSSILDTATDGVVLLSPAGDVLSLNRAAEALFGVDAKDLVGEPVARLFAPESQRAVSDYLDGLSSHGVASVLNDGREVVGLERKGGRIPLFMTIGRLSAGTPGEKFCAVLRDITIWKKAEADLTEAKRAAEIASHQKSDFLAKISHEIRTPLNAVIGFSEVMMEERFGALGNQRYKEYVGDVHQAGRHLLSLVDDLLDLSKIEAGKLDMTFSAVKLGDLIAQTVATMQPQANREGVILRSSVTGVPPVVADQRSLRQILFNLVSNAVRFTRPGGQVIVSATTTDAGEVALRVRDTGIGMTKDEIATALEPFRQIATSSRVGAGGTGLGLPLTKALAEANRAAFRIESAPDEGTLVEVTFPTPRVLAE
jgi:PAS domain S-box-containing protein